MSVTHVEDKSVVYTLSVTVKRPIRLYEQSETDTLEAMAEWLVGSAAKRELEREVLQTLRRLDGDCDLEVMEAVIVEE